MRYFKKLNPKNAIQLSNGRHVKFDTLNNIVGYFATDDGFILGQFDVARREQRGGINEIQSEEFERDYAQKKRNSPGFQPKPLNREEITPGMNTFDTAQRLNTATNPRAEHVAASIAISGSDIVAKRVIVPPPESVPVEAPVNVSEIPPPAPIVPPTVEKIGDIKKRRAGRKAVEANSNQEPLLT